MLKDMAFFSGELKTVTGEIVCVAETNMSINEREVYEFHYDYVLDDKLYSGASDGFYGDYKDNAKVR